MKTKMITLLTISLIIAGSFSCSKNDEKQKLSSEKMILSFEHEKLIKVEFLNDHLMFEGAGSLWSLMFLTWEEGTDLSSVDPIITVSPGAVIMPPSGTIRDFSDQVSYTVLAEDETYVTYLILSVTEDFFVNPPSLGP